MRSLQEFLRALRGASASELDRALATLWWRQQFGSADEKSASSEQIADDLVAAGYARPNSSRLKSNLSKDRRTNQPSRGVFKLSLSATGALDQKYLALVDMPSPVIGVEFLPSGIFSDARVYVRAVVAQANSSFTHCLYDCCAVMTRRLLETLIIDAYEVHSRQEDLKSSDGYYMMFSGLLKVVESGNAVHLGRATVDTLKKFKRLGDLSAHNRRYNARRDDLEPLASDLRVALQDMMRVCSPS